MFILVRRQHDAVSAWDAHPQMCVGQAPGPLQPPISREPCFLWYAAGGDDMRIYGGHDYYDCALSLGIDPTIVLLRGKSKSIPVKDAGGSLLGGREMSLLPSQSFIQRISIVFCNKLYRGAAASHSRWGEKSQYFWNASKLRAYAAEVKNGKVDIRSSWYSRRREKTVTLEEYFTPVEVPEVVRRYMIQNKISIMVERETEWHQERYFELNHTGLKQIGFMKALDPYTAFQELSMWIGGVLGGTSPEIVEIKDDRVLIENHGFDNRFSFRGPRL